MKDEYRRAVERQQVPDQLTERTLRAMRSEASRKKRREVFWRQRWFRIALPAAMTCCLLLVLGMNFMSGTRTMLSFDAVQYEEDPRLLLGARGSERTASALRLGESIIGRELSALLPDWSLSSGETDDADTALKLVYTCQGAQLSLTLTSFASRPYSAMTGNGAQMLADMPVYSGSDGYGMLMCGWQQGKAYCILESDDMSESEFQRVVESAIREMSVNR